MRTPEPGQAMHWWDENRDYLRRLLGSMTRDADMAEDLLQETYLRASSALGSYRGGNLRAWLSAIARSVFLMSQRRRWVRSEVPLLPDECHPCPETVGTAAHLEALAVRRAIEELSPTLRDALIMRHFGGFGYQEIGERLGCPTGTAKRRVWAGMQRLRLALAHIREDAAMRCSEIRGTKLLDYLYGSLPRAQAEVIESHLRSCETCGGRVDELRRTMAALESFRDELVFFDVYEPGEDGGASVYGSLLMHNRGNGPGTKTEFSSMKYNIPDFIFAQGEEARFETRECEDDAQMNTHTVYLPRPTQPGERTEMWYVFHTDPGGPNAAERLGEGRWRFVPDGSGSDDTYVRVLVVRLPSGARFVSSVPPPEELHANGSVSLVWRWFVRESEPRPERPVIEYHLPD